MNQKNRSCFFFFQRFQYWWHGSFSNGTASSDTCKSDILWIQFDSLPLSVKVLIGVVMMIIIQV